MKSYSDTTLGWAHLEKVARIGRGHSSLAGGTQPKGFEPTNDAISRSAIWREAIKDSGYNATICDPVECSDYSKNEILLYKWTLLNSKKVKTKIDSINLYYVSCSPNPTYLGKDHQDTKF